MSVAEAVPVSVSPRAARRIAAILAKEPAGAMLRVAVEGGGGSVIDFSDELIGAAFKIENPNATAACGCGTSFSL